MFINGARLYYEEHGSGPQTVIFAHGLLWSGQMFAQQVEVLQQRYRCVTFDWRGQGQSDVTQAGYDMESLYADTLALIDALGITACHFIGLSMGGFIGMRLAARRPDLVASLVLLDTSADPEPAANIPKYRMLNLVGRWLGFRLVAAPVMQIMFGQKFLSDPTRAQLREEWRRRLLANHRIGATRATTGVITRRGIVDLLGAIRAPTLILVGDQDVATPPAVAQRIHACIAHSQLAIIPGAGHTSTVEEPDAVNAAILAFLPSARPQDHPAGRSAGARG
jgi:pimeloyl-ACP methyl ester carboxylesterase